MRTQINKHLPRKKQNVPRSRERADQERGGEAVVEARDHAEGVMEGMGRGSRGWKGVGAAVPSGEHPSGVDEDGDGDEQLEEVEEFEVECQVGLAP